MRLYSCKISIILVYIVWNIVSIVWYGIREGREGVAASYHGTQALAAPTRDYYFYRC